MESSARLRPDSPGARLARETREPPRQSAQLPRSPKPGARPDWACSSCGRLRADGPSALVAMFCVPPSLFPQPFLPCRGILDRSSLPGASSTPYLRAAYTDLRALWEAGDFQTALV